MSSGRVQPYLFVLPLLACVAFFIYNLALMLFESTQHHVLAYPLERRFSGFENYVRILQDPMTRQSLINSLVWVLGTTLPTFVLGLGLALLLNQVFFGRGLYRALVLSPWAISGVVGAFAWAWMLNGPFGVLNDALVRIGLLHTRPAWLALPETAMLGVVISSVWRGLPFFAITYLAALQTISRELYEAAAIDGAGVASRFRYVTLPMLRNVLVITLLVRALWSFNFIENIFLMTYGGPANATTTWSFYLF